MIARKSKPTKQAEPQHVTQSNLTVLTNLEAFIEIGRRVLEGEHGLTHDGKENVSRAVRAAEQAAQNEKART